MYYERMEPKKKKNKGCTRNGTAAGADQPKIPKIIIKVRIYIAHADIGIRFFYMRLLFYHSEENFVV